MTRLLALTRALLIALVVGLAGAQADDTTGVTATSILIGPRPSDTSRRTRPVSNCRPYPRPWCSGSTPSAVM